MEIQCNYVHRGSLPRVGFIWYNASGDGQTLLTNLQLGMKEHSVTLWVSPIEHAVKHS